MQHQRHATVQRLLVLLLLAAHAQAQTIVLRPSAPTRDTVPDSPVDAATRERIAASTAVATSTEADISARYRDDLLLQTALKHDGDATNAQLEVLFQKCVTPGETITVGAVGGSITAGGGGASVGKKRVYIERVGAFLQGLCPDASVRVVNAARGGTGSLTTGLCLHNELGASMDLLLLEFSLNDKEQYTVGGRLSAAPYELLVRSALTAWHRAPALVGVYFWGMNFTPDSAQPEHLAVARHYGVTGVSMRDVVWPCVDAAAQPYPTRDKVLADVRHHPNAAVHAHLGDILSLHLAQAFARWAAAAAAAAAMPRGARLLLPPATLPPPLSPQVGELDLLSNAFTCELGGAPRAGPRPSLFRADGWKTFAIGARTNARLDSQECIQATRESASVLLDVETRQGHLIISSCTRIGSRSEAPSFDLRLVRPGGGGDDQPQVVPLQLRPFLDNIGEAFAVDPPLPPGRHIIEVVPRGVCASRREGGGAAAASPGTAPCTLGFYAVTTL